MKESLQMFTQTIQFQNEEAEQQFMYYQRHLEPQTRIILG
jgi:hypothetical protein